MMMKKYILLLLLAFSIVACTAETPSEPIVAEVEEPIPEEVNVVEPEEESVVDSTIGTSVGLDFFTQRIRVDEESFDPETLTVNAGDTVTFVNTGERIHSVTCNADGVFASPGRIEQGEEVEINFTEPGTYRCLETIFAFKGTVVVE